MSIFNDGPLKATCYRNGAHQKLTRPLFASGVINNNVQDAGLLFLLILKKSEKITISRLHKNSVYVLRKYIDYKRLSF